MKRSIFAVTILFVVFFLFTAISLAQSGGTGCNIGRQDNKMYNVNMVETITGEVIKVNKLSQGKGMAHRIHLLIKTNKETISVHLGPSWFLDKQKVKINLEDKVTLIGTRIIFRGSPAIIASEITKSNTTIILRNKNGFPLWNLACGDD